MLSRKKSFLRNPVVCFLGCVILVISNFGQSKKMTDQHKQPLIEVYTSGKGLVLESDKPILFFRLQRDGTTEYDSRTKNRIYRKSGQVSDEELKTFEAILEDKGFETIKPFYDSIQTLTDSIFLVHLTIMQNGSIKSIYLKNYMPEHHSADSFYPSALVNLLDEIQRVRPLNSFEKRNNLVLNLPM